jgi:hypothetical protein
MSLECFSAIKTINIQVKRLLKHDFKQQDAMLGEDCKLLPSHQQEP